MAPQSSRAELPRAEFVALMAALIALNALGIDAMLPALSTIGRDLHVAHGNQPQLVVGQFLLGLGLGSLIHGPLSDRFGRRPVILAAVAGSAVMALVCAISRDFTLLLLARLVHGFVGAAIGVVTVSIVRDRFSGDAMARTLSTIFMVFMIVPVVAPSLGQAILGFGHWRWIFYLLAGMAVLLLGWVWMRLPETLTPDKVVPLAPKRLAHEWWAIMRHRSATAYMLAGTMAQGGLYGYLNSGPQIFADQFHAERFFPTAFALVAVTMAGGNFINSRIVQKIGARRVSQSALICYVALGFMQVLAALYAPHNMTLFIVLIALNMSMIGLIGSNFGSIAMEPFGHVAGSASSFQQSVRTTLAALIGSFAGMHYDGTAVPMTTGFVVCGAAALALVLWAEKGRLFTRPGTAPIGRY